MSDRIDNSADLLDSRDIIARIEELQDAMAEVPCSDCDGHGIESEECATCKGAGTVQPPVNEDDAAELAALTALAEEAEGYAPDWTYGETLIRDSYFKDYAQELAEDCGMIPEGLAWPLTCIDWEQAARELQYDYTGVDFDGVTYWVRS